MHIYDANDGPTVTLTLPKSVAEKMVDAIFRYVPASSGVDQALVDEIEEQLREQRTHRRRAETPRSADLERTNRP